MILIVEDNPTVAELFGESLREAGYHVEVVGTGMEAVRFADRQQFDLVMVDLSLPDTNGAELAVQLRAAGCMAPMIAVSGAMPLIDPAKIRDAGFAEIFAKPIRISALLDAVARHRLQPSHTRAR